MAEAARKRSQVTIIFMVILGLMMLFLLVMMDISKVAMNKLTLDIATDNGAFLLGSMMASENKILSESHFDHGLYTGAHLSDHGVGMLVLAIIIIVIVIIIYIIICIATEGAGLASIVGVSEGIGALLGVVLVLTIVFALGFTMNFGMQLINEYSRQNGIVMQWVSSIGVLPNKDARNREVVLTAVIPSLAMDSVKIFDAYDFDRDVRTDDEITRFMYWYARRLNKMIQKRSNTNAWLLFNKHIIDRSLELSDNLDLLAAPSAGVPAVDVLRGVESAALAHPRGLLDLNAARQLLAAGIRNAYYDESLFDHVTAGMTMDERMAEGRTLILNGTAHWYYSRGVLPLLEEANVRSRTRLIEYRDASDVAHFVQDDVLLKEILDYIEANDGDSGDDSDAFAGGGINTALLTAWLNDRMIQIDVTQDNFDGNPGRDWEPVFDDSGAATPRINLRGYYDGSDTWHDYTLTTWISMLNGRLDTAYPQAVLKDDYTGPESAPGVPVPGQDMNVLYTWSITTDMARDPAKVASATWFEEQSEFADQRQVYDWFEPVSDVTDGAIPTGKEHARSLFSEAFWEADHLMKQIARWCPQVPAPDASFFNSLTSGGKYLAEKVEVPGAARQCGDNECHSGGSDDLEQMVRQTPLLSYMSLLNLGGEFQFRYRRPSDDRMYLNLYKMEGMMNAFVADKTLADHLHDPSRYMTGHPESLAHGSGEKVRLTQRLWVLENVLTGPVWQALDELEAYWRPYDAQLAAIESALTAQRAVLGESEADEMLSKVRALRYRKTQFPLKNVEENKKQIARLCSDAAVTGDAAALTTWSAAVTGVWSGVEPAARPSLNKVRIALASVMDDPDRDDSYMDVLTGEANYVEEAGELIYVWRDAPENGGKWHMVFGWVQDVLPYAGSEQKEDKKWSDTYGHTWMTPYCQPLKSDYDCVGKCDGNWVDVPSCVKNPACEGQGDSCRGNCRMWIEKDRIQGMSNPRDWCATSPNHPNVQKMWISFARFDEPPTVLGWPAFSTIQTDKGWRTWQQLKKQLEAHLEMMATKEVTMMQFSDTAVRRRMTDRLAGSAMLLKYDNKGMYYPLRNFILDYGVWSSAQVGVWFDGDYTEISNKVWELGGNKSKDWQVDLYQATDEPPAAVNKKYVECIRGSGAESAWFEGSCKDGWTAR